VEQTPDYFMIKLKTIICRKS